MSRTVYQHPDGPALSYCASELTATDENGNSVRLPIGPLGLAEVGNALLALAAEQEEKLTSERAGAAMGHDLLNELLAVRGKPQAQAFCALRDKLLALSELAHFHSAAGGFAGAVVNVLEVGIASLPRVEAKE